VGDPSPQLIFGGGLVPGPPAVVAPPPLSCVGTGADRFGGGVEPRPPCVSMESSSLVDSGGIVSSFVMIFPLCFRSPQRAVVRPSARSAKAWASEMHDFL
jgi:hypothetical protein